MSPFSRIIATTLVLTAASASHAQFIGGFGQRQAVGFHVRTGPYNSLTYVAGAYGFGFGPIYGPVPSWYYGWPGVPLAPYPVVVQPPTPVVIQNVIQVPGGGGAGPARNGFIPPEADILPPAAIKPVPVPKAARPAAPAPPAAPDLRRDLPRMPAAGAQADADRITEAGRRAFTDGQYGRALELFRRAAELTPKEPAAHYLVSQAQFALGKYREAVAAITTGMAVRPDWPNARFHSRDLYWKKPELYDDHLAALRQAVAALPDDPALVFLLGHQLWFDDRRDEARGLFQKAEDMGKGQTPAAAFLAK